MIVIMIMIIILIIFIILTIIIIITNIIILIIFIIAPRNDRGRTQKIRTARPNWMSMSTKLASNKDDANKIAIGKCVVIVGGGGGVVMYVLYTHFF